MPSVLKVALFLFFVSFGTYAQAGLTFCNSTGQSLHVAVGWLENGQWRAAGWYKLVPGACEAVLTGDLDNQYYYFYANGDANLQWSGENQPDSSFFCADKANAFDYVSSSDDSCDGLDFVRIDTGEDGDDFVQELTEAQTDPLQAALNCQGSIQSGRDAFAKCWMQNIATTKQREIIECYDSSQSLSAFAICANKDQFSDSQYRLANCADQYASDKQGAKFLNCIAGSELNTEQARIFDCAVQHQGNVSEIGLCAAQGALTPEQQRVYGCVANNFNNYINAGLCAASGQLNSDQSRIAGCVLNNGGNYVQMGVCAAGNNLTPEQQVFISCAATTGGQPYAFAGCVGTQLTTNELNKCLTEGIGGHGCFGENNAAVKATVNAWNDVTQGFGSGNEVVKAREALLGGDRGTGANIVRDPIRCLTFQRKC
jgi:uncharacterized membrane protein